MTTVPALFYTLVDRLYCTFVTFDCKEVVNSLCDWYVVVNHRAVEFLTSFNPFIIVAGGLTHLIPERFALPVLQ